jgi:hypothetical protein
MSAGRVCAVSLSQERLKIYTTLSWNGIAASENPRGTKQHRFSDGWVAQSAEQWTENLLFITLEPAG